MKEKNVYIIYAFIPERLWELKMKFVINESTYIFNGKEYDYDGNYRMFIYAWTTVDKLLKDFKYFREAAFKDIYQVKKVIMNKLEFSQFKNKYKNEKLDYYDIPSNDNEYYGTNDYTKILCTYNEYIYTIEEGHVYLYDYIAQIVNIDYMIFDKKFVDALDSLGYCDEYNILQYHTATTSDELILSEERYETSSYNASFGLTGFGNHKLVDLYANKFSIFVNLFYEMIEGYKKNEEIKLVHEE